MTTDTKNLTKAELLTLVADLQGKLAAANAAAPSGQVEDLNKQLAVASAEAASARNRVEELIAQLAEANAERSKLGGLLEAAHHDLRKHGAAVAAAPAASATRSGPGVVVHIRQGRELPRFRIGRSFTREETFIPLADLDQDQLEALRADRELVVTDHKPSQEAQS